MSIVAIILCGGRSSRMGTDKAHLPINGKRLVDHVADQINKAGIKDIVVSGEVRGLRCVADDAPNGGPMVGFLSTIKEVYNEFDTFLVLPVDLPLLSKEAIKDLISQCIAKDAVFFENSPLPFIVRKSRLTKFDILSSSFAQCAPNLSVKKFLKLLDAQPLSLNDQLASGLTNTNTPEEWDRAKLKFDGAKTRQFAK